MRIVQASHFADVEDFRVSLATAPMSTGVVTIELH